MVADTYTNPFFYMNKYFDFGTPFSNTPVTPSCNALDWDLSCKLVKGENADFKFPLFFEQIKGRKWTDVLNPSSVSLHLVSNRFVQLLEANKITGYTTFPVRLFNKQREEVFQYSGLSITGRCDKIDWDKSPVITKRLVPHGPECEFYNGASISFQNYIPTNWFLPETSLSIIVTEKLKLIIDEYNISNVVLKDVDEKEYMKY